MDFKPDNLKNIREGAKTIEEQANYQGDWTLLLRERLRDPITKRKFINTKQEEIKKLQNSLTQKSSVRKINAVNKEIDEILEQIHDYDRAVEEVFSSTKIGDPAKRETLDIGDNPLGKTIGKSSGWKDTGIVQNYTTKENRAKNITEAHEKIHGITRYSSIPNIEDMFDDEKMSIELQGAYEGYPERGVKYEMYTENPNEILARMSSLKNYFGMKASDIFTKDHLEYAQRHYDEDMDGGEDVDGKEYFTSSFLYLLKRENNDKFFEIINSYPI